MWIDADAVPLRDMWDITAGLDLHFSPKFRNAHFNNHVLYVPCPGTALTKRRLQLATMFPYDYPDAWPRNPVTGLHGWVYNDALFAG